MHQIGHGDPSTTATYDRSVPFAHISPLSLLPHSARFVLGRQFGHSGLLCVRFVPWRTSSPPVSQMSVFKFGHSGRFFLFRPPVLSRFVRFFAPFVLLCPHVMIEPCSTDRSTSQRGSRRARSWCPWGQCPNCTFWAG
jgi:hypothetical protein